MKEGEEYDILYRWIDLIALQVYRENLLPHSDIRKMRYAMTVLFNESIKLILLFLIFRFLGYQSLFLFSFMVLVSIRIFAGGIHCEKNISCFVASLIFFLLSVIILPQYLITIAPKILILISVTSVLFIIFLAPLPSPQRPIQSEKRKKRLQGLAIFFTLFWQGILWFFIQDPVFFSCGIWTIFLQSIQLLWRFSSNSERRLC